MKQLFCAVFIATSLFIAGQSGLSIAQVSSSPAQQYTCPMHPHYIADDPDGTCPICGMDLVPAASSAGTTKGDGSIAVAPQMLQTMGVRTAKVAPVKLGRQLRLFGTVQPDQRLESVAASRLEGWIKDLRITAVGDRVTKGDALYHIYSPDALSAQKDYLSALKIGNAARISAARQRLLSFGIQKAVLEQIKTGRKVIEDIPVYAETSGIVSALGVREGDYMKPGSPILRLQSYDQVWVIADVPERDLPVIDVGQVGELLFASAPGSAQTAVVDYLYPTIDPATRTGKMRLIVDNNAGRLRPGAYADIIVDIDDAMRLAVPTQAILRDSQGSHVIVALGGGRFAGRMVQIGVEARGYSEVLTGLLEGERVVANGQFLLDSEANLQAGLANLGSQTIAPDTLLNQLPIDAATLAQIDHITDMALYFHEALTDGYDIAPSYIDPAIEMGTVLQSRFAGSKLGPILADAQAALVGAKVADDVSAPMAGLMAALEPWLLEGAPAHYQQAGLTLYRDAATKRLWLQRSKRPSNPYGAGAAQIVAWPNPIQSMSAPATTDPHAGHR